MIEKIKEKIMQDRRIGRSSLEAFLEIFKEVEAEYGNGWIPCSERLPENHNNIIICTANGYVNTGYYGTSKFLDMNSYPYEDVVAWMPLPEPYKENHEAELPFSDAEESEVEG